MTSQTLDSTPRDQPPLWQFSIRHLLVWMAFAALACVALRNSTYFWISLLHSLALATLAVALLLSIYREGATRAYCVGFVVCGGLYMAVLFYDWSQTPENNFVVQREPLITTWLSKQAYQFAYPYTAKRQPVNFGFGGGGLVPTTGLGGMAPAPMPAPVPYPAPEDEFVDTAQPLWALLLAACGGTLARWLYHTRDREPR